MNTTSPSTTANAVSKTQEASTVSKSQASPNSKTVVVETMIEVIDIMDSSDSEIDSLCGGTSSGLKKLKVSPTSVLPAKVSKHYKYAYYRLICGDIFTHLFSFSRC